MSYTYEDDCIDCEVCWCCDGTGGTCVTGECYECNGTGMIHVCLPWEYRDYMEQQQPQDQTPVAAAAEEHTNA